MEASKRPWPSTAIGPPLSSSSLAPSGQCAAASGRAREARLGEPLSERSDAPPEAGDLGGTLGGLPLCPNSVHDGATS